MRGTLRTEPAHLREPPGGRDVALCGEILCREMMHTMTERALRIIEIEVRS